MTFVKRIFAIIMIVCASLLPGCDGSIGGAPAFDIDDGLSSDYFIKNLVITAPALRDPENPEAEILNMKYKFIPGEWENELEVPFTVSSIIITAQTSQSWSKMFLGEKELLNDAPSDPVALVVGPNIVKIRVVAQDKQELTYTINIARNTEEHAIAKILKLEVTGIPLNPPFDPEGDIKEFSANVNSEEISIKSIASAVQDGAKIEIIANDDEVTDWESIKLEGGMNVIKVICTSGDGKKTDTCTLLINRQLPSPSVKLSSLSIPGAVFNETFSPDTDTYTVNINGAMNPISITAQTESSIAEVSSVLLNGNTADIGSITVPEGPSTVILTVQNGAQTRDYTIKIECSAASTNANLKSLKVVMGTAPRPVHAGNFIRGGSSYHDPKNVKFAKTSYEYVTVIFGFRSITVTAAADDPTSKNIQFNALRHDGVTNAVSSQSFKSGTATAVIDLDIGYVTTINIAVTAGDETTIQTYRLYAKLLNGDEFHWGIYTPSFDNSKATWPTPSGISDNTYRGKISGTSQWKTGLSNNSFQGESYGAKSEIIMSNFNDGNSGTNYTMYNDGGIIINGTQFTYLKSASNKNGWNVSPGRLWVTTATGDDIVDYYYHLKVTESQPVQHSDGETNPALHSYTDMKYMGETVWHRVYFKNVKPYPFTNNNWFEPWDDGQ